MLGLKVNAGAGGLICQQRKEDVRNTGQAPWIPQACQAPGSTYCKPLHSSSPGHFWQHARGPGCLAHQSVVRECLFLAGAEPPIASRAPWSGSEPPSLEWAPITQGSIRIRSLASGHKRFVLALEGHTWQEAQLELAETRLDPGTSC